MLSDQELRALLAAASKGPWVAREHCVLVGNKSVFYDEEASPEDARLAAQAPDLAQEVLARREAGEALAIRFLHYIQNENYHRDWNRVGDPCLHCGARDSGEHTEDCDWRLDKEAYARWAELGQAAPPEGETEVGDG